MEARFWTHKCKQVGHTGTLKGEPCNYCDVTEEDIEKEDMYDDFLFDPELI